MSSILHFNNVLINPRPLLHGYSAHVSGRAGWIILVVHCGSDKSWSSVREAGISTEKHWRSLVHIPFGYTTQSTAGPGIVSVHKCHHHKHSQSRHVDAPVGFCYDLKTAWQLHSREGKMRGRHFLHTLNSTEVEFLHYLDPLVQKNR